MSRTSEELAQNTSRRALLRRGGLVVAGSVLALASAKEASAARRWCNMDPVVLIDGQLADIFLASDLKLQLTATGPAKIKIGLPPGSSGSTIISDLGFGLKGYKITFHTDESLEATRKHTEVSIAAYVPSSDPDLPLTVTFAPRSLKSSLKEILFGTSADGMVNEWVYLRV